MYLVKKKGLAKMATVLISSFVLLQVAHHLTQVAVKTAILKEKTKRNQLNY